MNPHPVPNVSASKAPRITDAIFVSTRQPAASRRYGRPEVCATMLAALFALLLTSATAAEWAGFVDRSTALRTEIFSFTGTKAEAYDSNENYYDGDFADFDGDGAMDRALGARFGLLKNKGGALMTPYAGSSLVNYVFRGFLNNNWGEDAFQWADVDNDGDLDILQGGNGEPFTLQVNSAGRFRTKWVKTSNASALNIVNIDIDKDGDVDLAVAHAFCSDALCGHGCPDANCTGGTWPKQFHLWVNDGNGNFTDEFASRGFPANFGTNLIVGVVAGDVDSDGDFDLMLINGAQRGITLARNNGSGTFTLSLIPFAVALAPIRPIGHGFSQAMNLGDIDGDGDLDLVMALVRDSAGSSNPKVGHAVFINDGAGNFTDQTATRFDASEYGGSFLAADNGKLMDADYDGDFDFLAFDSKTERRLQIFMNNGAGVFRYSSNYSRTFPAGSTSGGTGADTDITDLDSDGTYDLWIGAAGSDVRILINPYTAPDGLPANLPRAFRMLSANSNGVTLSWKHPAYADVARWYKVYRSTAPGLARTDWKLLKRVAISRHQDEGFAAPLTRFTTTAYLNDPDVTLVGASNEVQFIDRTAVPGVTYFYAVTHVGTENTESRLTEAVAAARPAAPGADTTPPFLEVLSPTSQDWSALPRIVIQYGDGGSGVDASTLKVSFSVPLGSGISATGGRPASADISDIFFRKDERAYIASLQAPLTLPTNTLVTLTASVSDRAGNSVTNQAQFFVSNTSTQSPVAVINTGPTNGLAPFTVNLSATNSTDADGKLFRQEWYFSDGGTAIGSTVSKTFMTGGTHQVTLLARDNDGGVAWATRVFTVQEFRVLNALVSGPDFSLSFPTATNRLYTLEWTASLPAAAWAALATVSGNGEARTFTHTNASGAQRFYRVRAE